MFPYPSLLPTSNAAIRNKFFVAPFWADVDLSSEGNVRYQTFEITSEDEDETRQLQEVNDYISNEENANFTGTWMLLVEWADVHPFPHGDQESQFSEETRAILELVRLTIE